MCECVCVCVCVCVCLCVSVCVCVCLLLRRRRHRTLDGDACCPHEGGCPPQLPQVAIQLVPKKRRIRPCVPPHSIM